MKAGRKPRWVREMGNVLFALARSRRALRHAARTSEDRRMSQRLRRLARRQRAAAEELKRSAPEPAMELTESVPSPAGLGEQVRTANEIGTTAACLRANRKLRAAVQSALDAPPPPRLAKRLEALREQTDYDAGTLNARLRELIVVEIPITDDSPEAPGLIT